MAAESGSAPDAYFIPMKNMGGITAEFVGLLVLVVEGLGNCHRFFICSKISVFTTFVTDSLHR
jgi:hypothetical protein